MASSINAETSSSSKLRSVRRTSAGGRNRARRRPINGCRWSATSRQGHAKLRQPGGQAGVDGDQPQVPRRLQVGAEGVLGDRNRDPGDDQHREQRHLEARPGKRSRIEREQADGRKADSVEAIAFPEEQAREQIERHHPEGALHRFAEAGEQCVAEGARDGHGRRPNAGQPQQRSQGEDASREDRQVHAGDDQQMKGAGAFKAHSGLVIQVGAVTKDHGAQHARVLMAEQQPSRQPGCRRRAGEIDQALAARLLHGMQPAGKVKSGRFMNQRNGGGFQRTHHADALLAQPGGGIPHSRGRDSAQADA